jgi:hypothetical protein
MVGATLVVIIVAAVAATKPRALADLIERKNCMVGIPDVCCVQFFACDEIHVRNFGFMQGVSKKVDRSQHRWGGILFLDALVTFEKLASDSSGIENGTDRSEAGEFI